MEGKTTSQILLLEPPMIPTNNYSNTIHKIPFLSTQVYYFINSHWFTNTYNNSQQRIYYIYLVLMYRFRVSRNSLDLLRFLAQSSFPELSSGWPESGTVYTYYHYHLPKQTFLHCLYRWFQSNRRGYLPIGMELYRMPVYSLYKMQL